MYVEQLGNPVIVIATATQLINQVENLFGSLFGAGSIDSQRKSVVDQLTRTAMSNPKQITVAGSAAYVAYMKLRCLSADPDPALWQWYRSTNPTDTATSCGCGTQPCRDYAKLSVQEIARASQGLAPTPIPPSAGLSPGNTLPIAVSPSQGTVFGFSPMMAGALVIGAAVLIGSSNHRGRR